MSWVVALALLSAFAYVFRAYLALKGRKGSKIGPESYTGLSPTEKPTLFAPASVYLSIVAPAYNEDERLPAFMAETARETKDKSFTWELLIVDDGSRDRTVKVANEQAKALGIESKTRVISLRVNCGKGAAVKTGMLNARGEYLLMADSDGATLITDVERLETSLKGAAKGADGFGIAIGSRAHLKNEADAVAQRKPHRQFVSFVFRVLRELCVSGLKDTQCGFKLFTRKAAQRIFPQQHVERWCFDIELLLIAQTLKYPICEIPVNWTEIPGSKLGSAPLPPARPRPPPALLTPGARQVVSASINMIKDLIRIRTMYWLGSWRVHKSTLA
eukprot:tig00021254_g19735.t1